jgi:hypothetical protein
MWAALQETLTETDDKVAAGGLGCWGTRVADWKEVEIMRCDERSFLRLLKLMLGVGGLALFATLNGFGAVPAQGAKRAKAEAMFPHLDAALGFLKAADQQLKQGEPIFYGHRVNAIRHTESAIADLQKGINDYMAAHPGATRNEAIPEPPASEAGDKYPHMRGALQLLRQAETHLNEAARKFSGERVAGLEQTRAAIAEIELGMKEAAAHHES